MVCVVSCFVFNHFYQYPPENKLEDCEEVGGRRGVQTIDLMVLCLKWESMF